MAIGFEDEGRWMYTGQFNLLAIGNNEQLNIDFNFHFSYIGGEDGTVKIWDLRMRNLQCQRIFQAGNIVNSVKLHPNQQEVLVGDAAGNVHVWNISTEVHQHIAPEKDASIQHVDIDPSG